MKSKKWLLGLVGLLLAGGLFLTSCEEEVFSTTGTLHAYNRSSYSVDAVVTMTLYHGGSIYGSIAAGPRGIPVDVYWNVSDIPAGQTMTLKVVDGYSTTYSRSFSVSSGGITTLTFTGSSIRDY